MSVSAQVFWFNLDRVHFLLVAGPVSAVFWTQYENDIDVVMLLVVAQHRSS